MRVKAAKCEAEIKKIVVSNGAFPVDFSGCVWVFCATFVSARIVLLEFAFTFDYFVFCSFGPGHISGSNTRIKYFAVRIHSYTKRQSHGLIEVEQKCGWRHARVIYVTHFFLSHRQCAPEAKINAPVINPFVLCFPIWCDAHGSLDTKYQIAILMIHSPRFRFDIDAKIR